MMGGDRFQFAKSWGAEPIDGGARFRLWAPAQERLYLRAEASGASTPMQAAGENPTSM